MSEMNRRCFMGLMIGGVAAGAAVRTWPFRVYSFASEVKIANWYDFPENFDLGRLRDVTLDGYTWTGVPYEETSRIMRQIDQELFLHGDLGGTFLDEKEVDRAGKEYLDNEGSMFKV